MRKKIMQNIIRYTKILINISTKILFVLLGLFLIYEIAYVSMHSYGAKYITFYKGQIVYQYIFWPFEFLYTLIFGVVIWKVWPQLSKLHKFYIHILLFLIPFFLLAIKYLQIFGLLIFQ